MWLSGRDLGIYLVPLMGTADVKMNNYDNLRNVMCHLSPLYPRSVDECFLPREYARNVLLYVCCA